MGILGENAPGRRPGAEGAARLRLERVLAGGEPCAGVPVCPGLACPGLVSLGSEVDGAAARWAVGPVLRLVPGRRALFRGLWEGQACVFRLDLSGTGLSAHHAELVRVAAVMGRGDFRVAAPLALLGGGAVLVTEFVEGLPLSEAIWSAGPEARLVLQARAAAWLKHHAGSDETWKPANRRPWRQRAEAGAARQRLARLRGAEAALLRQMKRLNRRLKEAAPDWRVAPGHGDFHAGNLLLDGQGRLWGIDLGAGTRAPVCRDIARFLVHGARRGMLPSGRRHCGVDAAGLASFAHAFGLTDAEIAGDLPFFLCHELLARVEDARLPQARIRHAREITLALCAELSGDAPAAQPPAGIFGAR